MPKVIQITILSKTIWYAGSEYRIIKTTDDVKLAARFENENEALERLNYLKERGYDGTLQEVS